MDYAGKITVEYYGKKHTIEFKEPTIDDMEDIFHTIMIALTFNYVDAVKVFRKNEDHCCCDHNEFGIYVIDQADEGIY